MVNPLLGLACLTITAAFAASAHGAVAARHYDFEEGTAGGFAVAAEDIVSELFFQNASTALWPEGHLWIEVAGSEARPLPGGGLVDAVLGAALVAPELEPRQGMATYVDVSNGSALDSPAVGSRLALSFDGQTFYDDANTGPGSRGVYVQPSAFENDDPVAGGGNVSESFNLVTQAWVRPSSEGFEIPQTVWQAGGEQGSVNITEEGFWEFRDLGSVGVLNPGIAVDYDAWTHLGIFRGGNGAEIYINGELVAGNRNPDPANFFGAFANLITLGGDAASASGFYGLVDDFKVMGTADVSVDPLLDMDFWAVEPTTVCDFTGDGACDISDLDALLYAGQAQQILDPYDLNSDGVVNLLDRDNWYTLASAENGVEIVPGDTNLDGTVVAGDLNALGTNWLRTDATSVGQGDFNGDGLVDAGDLNQIGLFWQHGVPAGAAAVPEPSGCPALLAALAWWLFAFRRR
jgi:hypothetical protein